MSAATCNALDAQVIAKTRANTTVTAAVYSGQSSFTRCVYEVKLQQVDLCLGEFWETDERRSITPFTSSIDMDTMLLVSMGRESLWLDDGSLLWVWAAPFSWQVWLTSLAMLMFSALMFNAVEYGYDDWGGGGGDDAHSKMHHGPWLLVYQFYQSLIGIWHRTPIRAGFYLDHEGHHFKGQEHAVSWAGRVVLYGYALFVFLMGTHYVAQCVKIYGKGAESPLPIKYYSDVAKRGGKVCLLSALYKTVEKRLPSENAKLLDAFGPVFEHLYEGSCIAALIGWCVG